MIRGAWLILLLMLCGIAHGKVEALQFSSAEQEARYKALTNELRCLVCQNQSIADSNAALAMDLRREVYQMIQRGDSNQAIADFMVARYGDFVLYRPPLNWNTMLLWAGPFLLLAVGLVVLFLIIRHRARQLTSSGLNDDERARIRQLLDQNDD